MDPNYALAHTQLGYAYAWTAVQFEENPVLLEGAKQEIGIAEKIDPQLAEIHVVRAFILWSQYEGQQIEAAIREQRLAQQLDPNGDHIELAAIYYHIGLEEQAAKEAELALERDPTSNYVKQVYVDSYVLTSRPEQGLAASQRLFNKGPDLGYYLDMRMLKEAAPLVKQNYERYPFDASAQKGRALLLALQGKHQEAQAAVPSIVEKAQKSKSYHHLTYDIARIYALGGNSEKAMEWLRVTVKEGFPCYTLFLRDSFLDRIRQSPAFIQFMAEMKQRWEGYQREFG